MRIKQFARPPALAGLAAVALLWQPAWGQSVTCPQTSGPSAWSGSTLDSGTTKTGVIYDGSSSTLKLQSAGGLFRSTALAIPDQSLYAASADFDNDGWPDFVGADEATSFVRVYRNMTFQQTDGNLLNGEVTPDWTNTSFVMPPKFTALSTYLIAPSSTVKRQPLAAADFDGDGWPDVVGLRASTDAAPDTVNIWINKGVNDASHNPQFNAAYAAMAAGSTPADMGFQVWGGSNIVALDYNGDRKIDLLVGSGSDDGTIRIFLNNCTLKSPLPSPLPAAGLPLPCATPPKFTYSGYLIKSLGLGTDVSGALPVFQYVDVDGDGNRDLLVGAPTCCTTANQRLRIWKGISGGGIEAVNSQSVNFAGALTTLAATDFSLDGKPDLIALTDNWNYNGGNGGAAYYYVNNGTSVPFAGGLTATLTSHNAPTTDYDVGFTFDYDNDPAHTQDVFVADGNDTHQFYILANRVVSTYVACGDVASGVIDLGTLSNSEMVVTSARLHPTDVLNGGTITFYMTNETPPNWITAVDCGDGTGDVCVTFPKPVGKSVQWKATMCSNAAHTTSPTLANITVKFGYTLASQHYQAGVIINDGIAYVGAFSQPGNRGKFYAVNAALSTNYWEAGVKLDAVADGSRKLFTANPTSTTLLPFTTANASNLISTLGATDATQATAVITWARSVRFGVGNTGIAQSRLGAIESSTPAMITPPARPLWYTFSSPVDRARVEAFIAANTTRVPLVLVGAMDGFIHAFYTISANIADTRNGNEAWGYLPPKIAGAMIPDYTASLGGTTTVNSFPDGSPTLADIKKANGTTVTVAVVASGAGGKSITAFDVTSTVNASTGVVTGPTPMWSVVPGGAQAGQSQAKPAVARVLVGGAEKYMVIAATGLASDNLSAPWNEGRIVSAYDAETGYQYWSFRALCPVTSDVTVFETDDALEPGGPTINGYADRIVFADYCGYVYKLDPAKDLAGATNGNAGLGAQLVDTLSGVNEYALFSTTASSGALAAQSPIAGTVAARTDASTRMVLFFGTGGIESWPASKPNQFYAVYADNGAIRSKISGTCAAGSCEKFYGGVEVTPDQVILTRTIDPKAASGTCDLGSSNVEALKLNANAVNQFVIDFNVAVGSAVMGGLYGDRGAIYFADLNGDVNRIGTPLAANAGDDSSHGYNPGNGSGASTSGTFTGTSSAFAVLGWRQVF